MGEHAAGFRNFRRKLFIGYGALLALLVALLIWKTSSADREARQMAVAVSTHSASAMAAHVAELIDAIDQPLATSAAAIGSLGRLPLTPANLRPMLANAFPASDSRFWLLFIDARGTGVIASNGLPVAGVSFAARRYFSEHAAHRGLGVYVGEPVIGHVSKRRVFFLSRRVESRNGEFLGVVAAAVDAERIADVFERSRIESSMSIALVASGGVIVARAPLFAQTFGADLSPEAPEASDSKPHPPATGSFAATSPFQGDRRIFSYVTLAKYPLVLAVGVSREASLVRQRNDFLVALTGLLVVLGVACLSGRFALSQFLRLEAVEGRQRKLIAELQRAQRALSSSERRLRMITDKLPARVAYINVDERIMFHNAADDGAPPPLGAFMGKTIREVYGDALYEELKDGFHRALAGEQISVEHCCLVDGVERYYKRQYTPDVAADGRVAGFYSMVIDITDSKRIEQQLTAIARIDSLTGLPNRPALLDRLEHALARCHRTGASLACLYLDIDKFKEVNDTLGHSGGDAALLEFSQRLRACIRNSDTVARLAGDEFVILLEALDQPAEAQAIAAKIIHAMQTPFYIEGVERRITTSIGVVLADPLGDDANSLLRAADAALYRAKREGRNRAAGVECGAADEAHGPAPSGTSRSFAKSSG
jgi:diguanylate cyclase (GGDEF)-like protein